MMLGSTADNEGISLLIACIKSLRKELKGECLLNPHVPVNRTFPAIQNALEYLSIELCQRNLTLLSMPAEGLCDATEFGQLDKL